MKANLYQAHKMDRVMGPFAAGLVTKQSTAFQLDQDNLVLFLIGDIVAGGTVTLSLLGSATQGGVYAQLQDQDGTDIKVTIDETKKNTIIAIGVTEPQPGVSWCKGQIDPDTANAAIDGIVVLQGGLRVLPITNGANFVAGGHFIGTTL